MSAGNYDMFCEQGATFVREFTVTDSSGDPIDYSGYTARMHVRRRVDSDTTLIELTTENGRITMNSSGKIFVQLSATETASLDTGGVYDLEIINSAGVVERLIEGNFVLSLEVTR